MQMVAAGKGLNGGTVPQSDQERILGPRQREEYNRLLKTKGRAAADDYKAQIAANKGIDWSPNTAPPTPFENGQPVTPPTFGGEGPPVNITPPPGGGQGINDIVNGINAGQNGQQPPAQQPPGDGTSSAPPGEAARQPLPDTPKVDASTPEGAMQGQGDWNKWQAMLDAYFNRVNESTPFGESKYTQNADGTWTRTVTLSPEEKAKYDQNQQFQGQLGDMLKGRLGQVQADWANPLNYDGIGNAPDQTTVDQARQRAEDASYTRQTRDYGQRFQKESEALQQQLADQGVDPGSIQYRDRMEALRKQQENQYTDARSRAMETGDTQALDYYNMGQDMRARSIQERMNLRNNSVGELGQLAQFREGVNAPNVSGISQVNTGQAPDVAGIGLGYANLNQNQSQFDQNLAEQIREYNKTFRENRRQFNATLAKAGSGGRRSGGGGGGGGIDPSLLAGLYAQPEQSSGGSDYNPWAGAAAAFTGGLGQGAGMYFGNKYGK